MCTVGCGLYASVEPSDAGAFEAAADVAVGLASRGAGGMVVAGLGVAAQPGDGNGVQRAVEVSVAVAVEPMAYALAAAGLEWGDRPG